MYMGRVQNVDKIRSRSCKILISDEGEKLIDADCSQSHAGLT